MVKGGIRHKCKDKLDMVQAHVIFELHWQTLADLGPYETVPRSGAMDPIGLSRLTPFLMDLVGQLCPSAEPKEMDLRNAVQRLLMMHPEINKTEFNNCSWINVKAERLITVLNHLRRLKRSDELTVCKFMSKVTAPSWLGNTQIINKRTTKQPTPQLYQQTRNHNDRHNQPHNTGNHSNKHAIQPTCSGLQALLDKAMLKPEEDSQSQYTQNSEAHVPALPTSSSSTSCKTLKRRISEVSLDSQGWPACLSAPLTPSPMSPEPASDGSPSLLSAPDDIALAVLMGYANSPTKGSDAGAQSECADDESESSHGILSDLLGFSRSKCSTPKKAKQGRATAQAHATPQPPANASPLPKAKAKAKSKAKDKDDPTPKATCRSTAPTLIDPESEKEPLFTTDGEMEHESCRTPNVKISKVKLDSYGQAKAEFEIREPGASWQNSPAKQSALKLMKEVDVRRRRLEKLRPDLFRMVDGKWQAINLRDID